ncbi:MAG: DUF1292 domain-containing protein [Erysipelotrichales bacterium]|nr:DUF1292 domain-containing protein [Erysipelotrichales bacterium]
MEDKSLIEILLDENNNDDIVLYDENDNETTFAQIAVIPMGEELYVILKPLDDIEGVDEDEAFVFKVNEDESNPIELCTDTEMADKVFEEYYKLLDENK